MRNAYLRGIPFMVVLVGFLPDAGQAASIAGTRRSLNPSLPYLETRTKAELKMAKTAFKSLRDAYEKRDLTGMAIAMTRIEQGVDLAVLGLGETGISPWAAPRFFKETEIEIRRLYRRLEYFESELHPEDRGDISFLKAKILKVQDELLNDLLKGTPVKRYGNGPG